MGKSTVVVQLIQCIIIYIIFRGLSIDLYGLYLPNMNYEFELFVDVGTVCIL